MDDFVNIGEDFELFDGDLDEVDSGVCTSGVDIFSCEPKDEFDAMCDEICPPPRLEFYLKAAKSRECAYDGGMFPNSLLCSPYKYHLKIVGPLEANELSIRIVFSESKKAPQCDKQPVVLDDVNVLSPSERIVKFSLHICSFHYRRKAFQLIMSCNGRDIFTSSPFKTYARKRSPPKRSPQPKRMMTPVPPPVSAHPYYQPFPNQRRGNFQPQPPQNQQRYGERRSNPQYAPRPNVMPQFPFNPYVNNFQQIRTSIAIQLLNSLSPMERQAVMNCAGFSN